MEPMDFCHKSNLTFYADKNSTKEARLKVQELVMERKIYNVNYRMEDASVYGEMPYLAGTTTVTNHSDKAVAIKYTDQSTRSFTSSTSLTSGVTTSIKAGVPLIEEAGIEVMAQISESLEWNKETSVTKEVSATDTVPVPAKSAAEVHYVGTKGTCDVPFSYTQQDRSSVDGQVTATDQIDGVFTGVNSYGFKFTVKRYKPVN